MKNPTMLVLVAWTIIACFADILFKSGTSFGWRFLVGMALYAVCAFPAIYVFGRLDFSAVVLIWNAVSIGVSVLIGFFLFKDHFSWIRLTILILTFSVIVLSKFDSDGHTGSRSETPRLFAQERPHL